MSNRLGTFFIVAVLLVFSVACAGPGSPAPNVSETDTAAVDQPQATEPDGFAGYITEGPFAGVGREPVTLRVLGYQTVPNMPAQQALIEEFQRLYPNIRIVEERVPNTELARKQMVSVASGNPPDIMYVDGPHVKFWAFNEVLMPLNDYFTDEEMADFFAAQIEEMSYKGNFYSPPERESAEALFYNVAMIEAAGIAPPRDLEDAWTWEEALEAFKKTTIDENGDGIPEIYGLIRSPGFPYATMAMSRSAGELGSPTYMAISEDASTVSGYLDTPEALAAYQFHQDLFQKWLVSPAVTIPEAFETGRGAFFQTTDFTAGRLELNYPDIEWAVTPLPYFVTPFAHRGSMSWTVIGQTQHPKEAAFFVKWMTDTEQAYKFWEISQQLPARKSVFERIPHYQEFPRDIYYKQLLEWAQPRPQTPGFRLMDEVLATAFTDIAQGADVEQTMSLAVRLINSELRKYVDR
jgi:fructooligosaccharide transport system substrate-binding protein